MTPGVTVVITAVPPRLNRRLAGGAVESVFAQTRLPEAIIMSIDTEAKGEAPTRNAGLFGVTTDWTAFLDDDDVLYPQFLERLLAHSEGYDLVYPKFDVKNGTDPFGDISFDAERMEQGNYIPVTYLVRTSLIQRVGGFPEPFSHDWNFAGCADWGLHKRLLRAGARYLHVGERLWRWTHGGHEHSNNRPWSDWDTVKAANGGRVRRSPAG